jgi:ATP-dependent Lon protease
VVTARVWCGGESEARGGSKAIRREPGEADEQQIEVEEFRKKIEEAGMPEKAEKEARRELDRLSKLPTAAAKYGVIRTYLDWLTSLLWSIQIEGDLDITPEESINYANQVFGWEW